METQQAGGKEESGRLFHPHSYTLGEFLLRWIDTLREKNKDLQGLHGDHSRPQGTHLEGAGKKQVEPLCQQKTPTCSPGSLVLTLSAVSPTLCDVPWPPQGRQAHSQDARLPHQPVQCCQGNRVLLRHHFHFCRSVPAPVPGRSKSEGSFQDLQARALLPHPESLCSASVRMYGFVSACLCYPSQSGIDSPQHFHRVDAWEHQRLGKSSFLFSPSAKIAEAWPLRCAPPGPSAELSGEPLGRHFLAAANEHAARKLSEKTSPAKTRHSCQRITQLFHRGGETFWNRNHESPHIF